jgi:hypothetical protein
MYSPIAAKLFRDGLPATHLVEQPADLDNDFHFSDVIDLLGSPLRC